MSIICSYMLCEVEILSTNFQNRKQAVILLHEIYGMNGFIQEQCQKFREAGFDVFCPNMINRPPFPYEESEKAYDFFIKNIGFEVYRDVSSFIGQLSEKYENVFVIGFSVGATIAWRCCENSLCSGVIACYGSRIRDYTDLVPACPVLLLFAKKDSFDVPALVCKLQDKQHLSVIEFDAKYGFVDPFSRHFNLQQSKRAEESIACFMHKCTN